MPHPSLAPALSALLLSLSSPASAAEPAGGPGVEPEAPRSPAWTLEDAGAVSTAAPALIVVTPGVHRSAYADWIDAIEDAGLDAWIAWTEDDFTGPDAAAAALAEAVLELGRRRGPWRAAAHGLGGVLLLRSGASPERLALVATPLAARRAPIAWPLEAGADAEPAPDEGLPWPAEWVGALPPAPLAPALREAYVGWTLEMPAFEAPGCPALLVTTNVDAVAPPELVRTPSLGWPDRTWERWGYLSLQNREPDHAGLLSDRALATRVGRFLSEGG